MLLLYSFLDGNFETNYMEFKCTHTLSAPAGWWVVDLGDTYNVGRVSLTNRGDCCGNLPFHRLKIYFKVHPFCED